VNISSLEGIAPELFNEELKCSVLSGWDNDSLLKSPMLYTVVSLVVSSIVLACNDDSIAFILVSGVEAKSGIVDSKVR